MRAWRGLRPDADFIDLPWQGWVDAQNLAVETGTQDCAKAIYLLTQQGYVITGINRSAKLLHLTTPLRIAMEVREPLQYPRASSRGIPTNMRICTHGER
jgi:hypothetical protein